MVRNAGKRLLCHVRATKPRSDCFCCFCFFFVVFFLLCWGLTTHQPLWVISCRLPEKGRKEIEEIGEEIKERDREERGTGMKVETEEKTLPLYPYLLQG